MKDELLERTVSEVLEERFKKTETTPVVAFALSTDDFKEVICAMKYIEMSYTKEGFLGSATLNSRIRESLIQQAAHIVNINI